MNQPKYVESECNQLAHLFNGELILVVSATDIETTEIHKKIKPLNGFEQIVQIFAGELTYYFGMLGNYNIAHVQCSMGSLSRSSSTMTISAALQELKSKVVIMIGIAFGVDETKQKIGDVLVSESIVPYNIKRIGKDSSNQRGKETQSSKILLNRFYNLKTTWEYLLPNNQKAELIPTPMLSGEELIDNLKHRNKLVQEFPNSRGGEMEGAGLCAACDSKADWIIVKGICDFANGEKGVNKKENQTVAINAALDACLAIFNSNSAFSALNISPVNKLQPDSPPIETNINEVLFDIYDLAKEKFYIKRNVDTIFNQTLTQYGIWLYGPSGCGKSNLIIRNLQLENKTFIQVNLAASIGLDIETFFREILYEITANIKDTSFQIQPKSFSECTNALLNMLQSNFKGKELIIFIEEIPISTDNDYKDFCGKLFSLIILKNSKSGLDKIKFVLSSINNPLGHLQEIQQKVHQQLNFFGLSFWSEEEITSLVKIIENEFKIQMTDGLRNELIEISKGSPRFIKKFFRSVYTLKTKDAHTLQFLLKETQRELNHY